MSHSLRVGFAGTPDFAAAALAAVHAAGFPIPLVLTQPDRPAGRGMKTVASPVKRYAEMHGLTVAQPPSLRLDGKYPSDAAAAHAQLRAAQCDVMVVAAYGLLLPQAVLDIPRRGCINIHASLLPRWRGAAPIHRAIEAGDAQTGITLMQMDAGLDTGPMLTCSATPIQDTDTTGTLHDRLAAIGAQLIVTTLAELEARGTLPARPQPSEGATYAAKIDKHEALLDWRLPAPELACKVRAFDPFPGAVAMLDGAPLKLWAAQAITAADSAISAIAAIASATEPITALPVPGTIVAVTPEAIDIACGDGVLRVTQCQKAGGKRLAMREFLAGFPLSAGQCFVVSKPS